MEMVVPPIVIEMLEHIEPVFTAHDVDFYIVGAMARDLHLAKIRGRSSSRKSKDIDLAIMISNASGFEALINALVSTGDFSIDREIPIKLYFRNKLEVDLLPFGGIENKAREVILPGPAIFRMDMPGFLEVADYLEVTTIEKFHFKACSVEGLILLKLYSWNDRPGRTKDLSDIDELIISYIDLCDRVFNEHYEVLEFYNEKELNYLELVAGRVIGRVIRVILNNDRIKIENLIAILRKRPVPAWAEIAIGLTD